MPGCGVQAARKPFGEMVAVKDVSFEVEPGEIFGLLGPNGAGKTTAIRMMLGIYLPDAGEVDILGGPLDEAKKNRIGYLPEERGLYLDQKLEPTLVYLATLKGLSEAEAKRQTARLARAHGPAGLPGEEDQRAEQGHAAEGPAHRHACCTSRN